MSTNKARVQTFEVDRVFTSKSTQIEVSTNKARVQTFEVDRVFTSKSTQIEVSTNKARVHPDRGEYQQGQGPDLWGGQGVYQQEYPDRGEYQQGQSPPR